MQPFNSTAVHDSEIEFMRKRVRGRVRVGEESNGRGFSELILELKMLKLKDYERIKVRNFHEWNKRKGFCVVLCWLREREREPKGGLTPCITRQVSLWLARARVTGLLTQKLAVASEHSL
ncbi:hypothetical protein QL285_015914 [Trifolium repens]|nr:hypothetical protein QL285_015914 [Trifolium repens]